MSNAMAGQATKVVEFVGQWFSFHKVPYSNNSAVAITFDVDQSCIKATTVMPTSGGPTPSLGSASAGLITVTLPASGSSTGGYVTVLCTHGTTLASGNRA